MNYKLLAFEEASVNVEKMFLLLESQIELEKAGQPFYEEDSEGGGIISKVVGAIKHLIEKIRELFTGKKEVKVTPEQKQTMEERSKIVSKLKGAVTNKKLWAALGATVAVGAGVAGVKHHAKVKKEREDILKEAPYMTTDFHEYNDCMDALTKAFNNKQISKEEFDQNTKILSDILNSNVRIIDSAVKNGEEVPKRPKMAVNGHQIDYDDPESNEKKSMKLAHTMGEKYKVKKAPKAGHTVETDVPDAGGKIVETTYGKMKRVNKETGQAAERDFKKRSEFIENKSKKKKIIKKLKGREVNEMRKGHAKQDKYDTGSGEYVSSGVKGSYRKSTPAGTGVMVKKGKLGNGEYNYRPY